MFGRGRRSRTHTEQLLDELTESYGHLRMAAGHAAGGAAEKITPSYDKARNVASRGWNSTKGTFAPLYDQVREGAANARRESHVSRKNRWPVLVGLLAAGAAVGAAGAMVARRRRATAQWDEYEPMVEIDDATYGADATTEPGKSATKKVTEGAASVAESVSTQAGKLAHSLHGRAARSSSAGSGQSATGGGAPAAGSKDNGRRPPEPPPVGDM